MNKCTLKMAPFGLFIIILTLLLCGCYKNVARYEKIDDRIVYSDKVESFFHYYDGNNMLLSVGSRSGLDYGIGPIMTTNNFILYDEREKSIEKIYQAGMRGQAYSAIPYKNGIIYVDYMIDNSIFMWEIWFMDDERKYKISEGTCSDFFQLPNLTLLDNVPIYLYINLKERETGINIITENSVEKVIHEDYGWISVTSLSTNFKEIAFTAKESEKRKIIIVNTSGVVSKIELDGSISSYTLTQNDVLCSIHNEEESLNYNLLKYNFRNHERAMIPLQRALYRMTGGCGEDAVCVDENYNVYKVDVSEEKIVKIEPPPGYAGDAIAFLPGYNNKFMVGVLKNNVYSYYSLDIK